MALIKCSECGKEISDKAETCPSCGCPIEKPSMPSKMQKTAGDAKEENKTMDTAIKAEKKKSSKKIVIIVGSIIGAIIIGVIIFFVVTADSRNYDAAKNLYNDEKYEEALQKFTDLDSYKDSKAMIEKCEYALSADGQFMSALSKGLMARWDLPEENKSEEEIYKDNTNIELEYLTPFQEKEFDDKALGESAKEYIDILNRALNSLNEYTIDYNSFYQNWNSIYAERTMLIKKFVNDFGLTVDTEHKSVLDDLLRDASGAETQQKMKQEIKDMVDNFVLTPTTDEWGITSYRLSMENATKYTFEYFYVDINALDESGNILGTGQAGQVSSWQPGQKAEVDAWVSVDNAENIKSVTYTPHYQSGNYYE